MSLSADTGYPACRRAVNDEHFLAFQICALATSSNIPQPCRLISSAKQQEQSLETLVATVYAFPHSLACATHAVLQLKTHYNGQGRSRPQPASAANPSLVAPSGHFMPLQW